MEIGQIIIGILVGAGACAVINKASGNGKEEIDQLKKQLDTSSDENTKLRKRLNEAESSIANQLNEIKKLNQKIKDIDVNHDELEDKYEDVSEKYKKTMIENDSLQRKIKEYETACRMYEDQINNMNK